MTTFFVRIIKITKISNNTNNTSATKLMIKKIFFPTAENLVVLNNTNVTKILATIVKIDTTTFNTVGSFLNSPFLGCFFPFLFFGGSTGGISLPPPLLFSTTFVGDSSTTGVLIFSSPNSSGTSGNNGSKSLLDSFGALKSKSKFKDSSF